ncbi:MAG: GNAT family N-acetyltransferase [Chitinophagaceae bacterium]|nr:MAG: GNAT family N-acetyltransferase [Chitinophagaceae bacterium]
MQSASAPAFQPATSLDIPALIQLLNSAYRGDAARAGWTHEADLIEGEQRTDANELRDKMEQGTILCTFNTDREIVACVYLEAQGPDLYLGMLSVRPHLQGTGLGKQLLRAAEEHARSLGCNAIVMTVISVRTELLQWYLRHGYVETGAEEPFPDDPRFGKPRQQLFFKWLRKEVK